MKIMSNEEVSSEGRPDDFLALSRFKEEIEKQAHEKASLVLTTGKEEASKILEAGKNEADKFKSEMIVKARSEANQLKIREVSRKKLSVKMDFLDTRDKVFDDILMEAKSGLQKYTKSKDYSGFLQRLLKDSARSMNGGDLIVHLRSEDKSLLSEEILKNIGKEISAEAGLTTSISVSKNDLNTLGGLKVIRSDDRLFVDNTFEARLVRMEDEIRVSLANLIES